MDDAKIKELKEKINSLLKIAYEKKKKIEEEISLSNFKNK